MRKTIHAVFENGVFAQWNLWIYRKSPRSNLNLDSLEKMKGGPRVFFSRLRAHSRAKSLNGQIKAHY